MEASWCGVICALFSVGEKKYAAAPITLYLSHLRAKADAGQFEAEEPNQPRHIIRVFGWKKYTVSNLSYQASKR